MHPSASSLRLGGALRASCLAAVLVLLPGGAIAKSHLWDMLVVFSNAQGNVQFINMFVSEPEGIGEWHFGGKTLDSNQASFVFPSNLPMTQPTYLTWVLIATQDYADLPGAPTPDFIIPPNFFDPAGDALSYRQGIDVFTIPAGAMPTDGIHALAPDLSTPVNVAINFAGESGTVLLTAPLPSLSGGALAVVVGLLGAGALYGVLAARRARSRG